ncbi:MAG: hypothetical protein ACSHYB_12865 [Roseibacillus sp.]
MKAKLSIAVAVILALLIALIWRATMTSESIEPQNTESTLPGSAPETAQEVTEVTQDSKTSTTVSEVPTESEIDDLSSNYLKQYGSEDTSPQQDLVEIAGVFDNYFLLVKSPDPLPVGENRETTAALLGKNPFLIRFLSPDSPWISEQGEFLDRWESPLYFHAIDINRVGVRSAGPDRQMWTEDDLVESEDAQPLTSPEQGL